MGRDWHDRCFVCTVCSKTLNDEFFEKDGKPFCEKDYDNSFLISCAKCGQKIQGNVLRDNKGGVYHPSCFCCNKCGVPLGTNFFWSDGLAVCEGCGTTKNKSLKIGFSADKCNNCKMVIDPGARVIHAGGMKYHEKCFVCSVCKGQVASNGKTFSSWNGMFCCGNCLESGKAQLCDKCGQVLLGNKVSAVGKAYHDECFRCANCRTLIAADSKFFVSPGAHEPLCSLCQSVRQQ
jgi:paxillin